MAGEELPAATSARLATRIKRLWSQLRKRSRPPPNQINARSSNRDQTHQDHVTDFIPRYSYSIVEIMNLQSPGNAPTPLLYTDKVLSEAQASIILEQYGPTYALEVHILPSLTVSIDVTRLDAFEYAQCPMQEPESSIRLLKVRKDCWNRMDGVKQRMCTLETVAFSSPQHLKYLALSYTWEAPLNTMDCLSEYGNAFRDYIIGEPKTGAAGNGPHRMRIGRNLFEGLMRISDRVEEEFYIWVDQICINQDLKDPTEKNAQIPLMASIYRQAQCVVAWLGEGTPELEDFRSLHAELAPKLKNYLDRHGWDHIGQCNWDAMTAWQALEIPSDRWQGFNWKAYGVFYARTRWFHRAWVLQEVAGSSRLLALCGSCDISWSEMVLIATFLSLSGLGKVLLEFYGDEELLIRRDPYWQLLNLNNWSKIAHSNMDTWLSTWGLPAPITDPEQVVYMYVFILLISLRECGASDPRDKVFALLGVLETSLPAASVCKIRPNYHETYTTRDAYTEITKMLLKMLPNFWVLSFVGDPSLQNTELRLPSWVPDLTCPNVESMQNLKGRLSLYAAASSLQRIPYEGELLFDGFTLTLKGVHFDTAVESIPFKDDHWAHKIGWDEYIQRTGKRLSEWLENVLQTSYDEPADSVLWKTITAGKSSTLGFPVITDKTFRDFVVYYMMKLYSNKAGSATFNQLLATVRSFPTIHTAFKDLVTLATNNRGEPSAKYLETITGLHQSTDIFTEAWGLQTPNHILFRTSKGRFGQGPVSLQPDDQIWLISNAQMPLVLRPVEGTDSFNLIGVAYIHGCMHGELVVEWGDKYQSVKIV